MAKHPVACAWPNCLLRGQRSLGIRKGERSLRGRRRILGVIWNVADRLAEELKVAIGRRDPGP